MSLNVAHQKVGEVVSIHFIANKPACFFFLVFFFVSQIWKLIIVFTDKCERICSNLCTIPITIHSFSSIMDVVITKITYKWCFCFVLFCFVLFFNFNYFLELAVPHIHCLQQRILKAVTSFNKALKEK